MNYGINNLWPTQVLLEKIQNQDILDSVVQEILTSVNLMSPPSDFQKIDILKESKILKEFRDCVVVPTFSRYLKEVFDLDLNKLEYSFRSWLTGTSVNYMIPPHNHSGSSFASVFYLLCEEKNHGGELFMMDPRTNANRSYTFHFENNFKPQKYIPQSGEVLVFPSYLYHYTLPFTGNLRIAMPVDLFIKDTR